ncbi:MAG: S-methyl-5-thioribose-1-phosphate isomerase [Candidatus Omnitrophica bacterium]|nr:S-methyl-5-thioribose-1-phosphate isomerase [Candidatus Omnitrophota bacterium]
MKQRVTTVSWNHGALKILDQTLLPDKVAYVSCTKLSQVHEAIRKLRVRGAPAIGVCAAWGVYLGLHKSKAKSAKQFINELNRVTAYLATSRPTAVNLFWALDRMTRQALKYPAYSPNELKEILFNEAAHIAKEDSDLCDRIGKFGEKLFRHGDTVLTHCNAGSLATAGSGTALSPIYAAKARGKKIKVFADETRPLLQGARLTAWELMQNGVPVTVICDNMAGSVMAKGKINKIIVGADRIAANGDTANKIGTYPVAVLAKYHNIPFYVAAPSSTFDFAIPDGGHIPIEERHADEVRRGFGKLTTPENVDVHNPAFDVTPNELITAIVTDQGVFYPPFTRTLKKIKNENH